MAIKSYNRIFTSDLSDIAGELEATVMEEDVDLNEFIQGNINKMHSNKVICKDYEDVINSMNS